MCRIPHCPPPKKEIETSFFAIEVSTEIKYTQFRVKETSFHRSAVHCSLCYFPSLFLIFLPLMLIQIYGSKHQICIRNKYNILPSDVSSLFSSNLFNPVFPAFCIISQCRSYRQIHTSSFQESGYLQTNNNYI